MIHGYTDQPMSRQAAGALRTGGPKGARTPGQKLDHFRFVPKDPTLAERFTAAFGATPAELPVLLPSDEWAEVFPHTFQWWAGSTLQCEGDNKTARRRQQDQIRTIPCNDQCPHRRDYRTGRADARQHPCQITGRLRVFLPDLEVFDFFELTTHTVGTGRIRDDLKFIEKMCGRLMFVPLKLWLEQRKPSHGAPFYVARLSPTIKASELLRRGGYGGQLEAGADTEDAEPPALEAGQDAPAEATDPHQVEDLMRQLKAQYPDTPTFMQQIVERFGIQRLSQADEEQRHHIHLTTQHFSRLCSEGGVFSAAAALRDCWYIEDLEKDLGIELHQRHQLAGATNLYTLPHAQRQHYLDTLKAQDRARREA